MEELKIRQKQLLNIVVNTYVHTVNPVGSKTIAQYYEDKISPATIRNEMHELEMLGYITHPHTSAGRIPTSKGYRYFVDHLLPQTSLYQSEMRKIIHELESQLDNMDMLVERTSKILSTITEQAGFVIFPNALSFTLKKVEITRLNAQRLLVIWMTQSGFVYDRVIDMKEHISDDDLKKIYHLLNQELAGLSMEEVSQVVIGKLEKAQDSIRQLYQLAQTIVSHSLPNGAEKRVALEGSHFVLEQPEFQDWEKSKRLIKVLENKAAFFDLFSQTKADEQGVQIYIGEEHRSEDLADCSLIAAHYFLNDRPVGSLGVIGPRRMPYGRAISLVHFMASHFGQTLNYWM